MSFTLARRAERMNPSVIREILKVTEKPGIVSLAGGLPSPESFPVEAMRAACERVLRDTPKEALQYAASEGFGPLREWVAAGARGFVNADADATALGRAVVGVARDDVLVLGGVLEQLGGLPSVESDSRLTTREAEVRGLLEQGLADKQIAHRLGISVKTVEKHVSAILRKANVRSRTELLVRI